MRSFKPILVVVLLVTLAGLSVPAPARADVPWPTNGWKTSTPEEQGMKSDELAEFIKTYTLPEYNFDSIIVVRHGNIVAEAYSAPTQADIPHHMYSASKSVISGLIGIALDQGLIKGVDEKVLGFFPDYTPANLDDRKASMTLKDLLTMGSGFKCDAFGEDPSTDNVDIILNSKNGAHQCLDTPMAYKPGEKQQYCQCNTYLLASILAKKTGVNGLDYARKNMFTPLGITESDWLMTPEGIVEGFAGLQLKSRDMAKIGYLYVNKGQWDGKQIISSKYVSDSTSKQIATAWQDTSYGYQWWTTDSVHFSLALGHGGQYIMLDPTRDLFVVLTGGYHDMIRIYTHVFPFSFAVSKFTTASSPLPADPAAVKNLQAVVDALANPKAVAIPAAPAITKEISGEEFAMMAPMQLWTIGAASFLKFKSISLKFEAKDQATLVLTPLEGQAKAIALGLDGLYRVSDFWGGKVAARAQWLTDKDFRIYLKYIGDALSERIDISFLPNAATIVVYEFSQGWSGAFAATVAQPE